MRYMIFCGAPAHLIGMVGCVNRAVPPRKLLIKLPGVLGGVGPIIAADAIASQRIRQALDGVPVDLEAGAGDEEIVADLSAVREPDHILFRMKACRGGPDPRHALRDELFLAPFGLLAAEDAGADQRPARLVPGELRWP